MMPWLQGNSGWGLHMGISWGGKHLAARPPVVQVRGVPTSPPQIPQSKKPPLVVPPKRFLH